MTDTTTLPELTDLVGRKAEVAEIRRALPDARLVTIIGPGGVGKTRVALRAARQSAARYADGIRFVELSGLSSPDLLAEAAAASLGLVRQGASGLDAVLGYLRTRRLLLVLDTCEHLIEACAVFTEAVLREAPGVTVLATSRQPLDAAGERTYRLLPLPVPGGQEPPGAVRVPAPRPESLTGAGDAAELFALRAAAADPAFEVTSDNWADVVRVCRRLDGIPLAIELAAVRLRALTLGELADRLQRRFDMLAARRGGTPRHQTLRTAIEWSHDLCTRRERELWARLSVFAGDFGIDAAEQVCACPDVPSGEILTTLVGLVDKSVVTRDGTRYRMLDTIREFGVERLAASGQEPRYRQRHAARYLESARSFAERFLDADQLALMGALRADHANLRAAMQYALTSGDSSTVRDGAELATALYGYWTISGQPREGRHWLGMALARLPAGPSRERAWALIARGYLGTYAGEPAEAVQETTAGLRTASDLGDDGLLSARAHLYQNMALIFAGRLEEAFAAGERARGRLEALEDRIGLLFLDAQMGHLHELAGDLDAAIEASERCLARLPGGEGSGEAGELWLRSYCYMVAGLALLLTGKEADSRRYFTLALRIKRELGDIVGCGYALEGLGWLAASGKRHDRAAWLLGGADGCWEQVGARLGGNTIMEKFHREMTGAARLGLGEERFAEMFAAGAGRPLDQLAERAISDADELGEPEAEGRAPKEPPRPLTAREREIAELVASGMSNREIAERLVISVRTVDSHVEHIFAKLGISSRAQLAVMPSDDPGAPDRSG